MTTEAKILTIEFALKTYDDTIESVDKEGRPQEVKAQAAEIFTDLVRTVLKSQ